MTPATAAMTPPTARVGPDRWLVVRSDLDDPPEFSPQRPREARDDRANA